MENKKNFIMSFLYYAILIISLYFLFRYAIYYIMPFIIGFLIAFMLRPIYHKLSNITHLPEKLISALTILIFYATIGTCLIYLCIQAFYFLKDFILQMPFIYTHKIDPFLTNAISDIKLTILSSNVELYATIRQIIIACNEHLASLFSSFSLTMMNNLTSFASSVPNLVVSLVFTVTSSFIFALDIQKILYFIKYQFNDKNRKFIQHLKLYAIDSIANYFIAYGKLMMITFIELVIGLFFLDIDHVFVIAFIIALFDFFPILGTGGIMFPWALIELLSSHQKTAVGLLILQLIITLIHNIIEPKIIGNQIGVHPIIMLLCMYLGGRIFGIMGIFLMPILVQIIQNLNKHNLIHLYKHE